MDQNPYNTNYRDPRHILVETNITQMLQKVAPTFEKEINRFQYDFSCFPLHKPPLEKSYLPNHQKIERSDYLRGYFRRLAEEKEKKND